MFKRKTIYLKVRIGMTFIQNIISFILHIDEHLIEIIQNFGNWSYVILFLIVFVETGIVIFPFLPGDSLLFAAGALAAMDAFNIVLLILVFFVAAVLGDTINYHIGKAVGTAITQNRRMGKFIDRKKMRKAEDFFNKHGGKTIVIARFMPFVRTFIPFIAGSSRMNYRYFFAYNVIGAVLWVGLFTTVGYLFGNIPFVKNNFSTIILSVIVLSVLPVFYSFAKSRFQIQKN
ncbi:DedA family membrane protein [Sporosarcina newyorkensis 2681]|uniref:DedA family membrane protein n=2 Tax=Sporosarcina newyorkensis TaxID=759851 RepID=F9DUM8_9BACL|nr:DedA family membrane protein [Sporosarcina newyorkensis 2681]